MQSEVKTFCLNTCQDSPLDLSRGPAINTPTSSCSNSRSNLPCHICSKCFDRPSLLKRHMRTHTGEKPHVCDICGKAFSTSSSLNTHRRIHSGEKPHQCPICGKRFTASSNLYYHRMTHTKDKPHKCLTCNKSFPTPGDLRAHGYTHTGSWPFRCSLCQRGFSKQTNLRNHLFLHTGDKPHKCEVCDKRFALACNLRAHSKTHGIDFSKKDNQETQTIMNISHTTLESIKLTQEQMINWNESEEFNSSYQTFSTLDYHLLLLHLSNFHHSINFQKIATQKL